MQMHQLHPCCRRPCTNSKQKVFPELLVALFFPLLLPPCCDFEVDVEALESDDDFKLVCCCFDKEPKTPALEQLLEKTLFLPLLMLLLLLPGKENLTCFSGPSVLAVASSVAEDDIPAKITPSCNKTIV